MAPSRQPRARRFENSRILGRQPTLMAHLELRSFEPVFRLPTPAPMTYPGVRFLLPALVVVALSSSSRSPV